MDEMMEIAVKDIPMRKAISRSFPVLVASGMAGMAGGWVVSRKVQKMTTAGWVTVGLLGSFIGLAYYIGSRRGRAIGAVVPGTPLPHGNSGSGVSSGPATQKQAEGPGVQQAHEEIKNLFGGYLGEN